MHKIDPSQLSTVLSLVIDSVYRIATMDNVNKFAGSIREKYKERRFNREKQWPPCHSSDLVRLELVGSEAGRDHFTNQKKTDDVVIKRTPLAYGDLFKGENKKKQVRKILVEGDAGIGKTTFCTTAAEDWANGRLFEQFELLLLLPLRHKKVSSASSISELLKLLHSSQNLCLSVADSLEENEGRKVLIVADGWDEVGESDQQEGSFLYELLFGEMLPFVSVVITSRPSASAALHRLPHIDLFVEICGFSRDNVKEYILSEFTSSHEKARRLLEQLEKNPLVESICHIPLNCAIVCHLWHTLEEVLPTTMTKLYTKIILNVVLRNVQKIDEFQAIKELSSFDALPVHLQQSWWYLCEFAFQAMKMNRVVFSEKDLDTFFARDLILDKKILCFGLLQSAESILETGCGVSFHFLHLTFQEYLAALHLVRHLLVKQSESSRQLGEIKTIFRSLAKSDRFVIVWRFFFGLFVSTAREMGYSDGHGIQSCFRSLSKFNFEYYEGKNLALCHCAFEANSDIINNRMLESLERNSPIVLDFGYPRTAHDCAAVLYVIANMPEHSAMEINFSDCGVREYQVTRLADILATIAKSGKLQVQELNLKGNKLPDNCLKNFFHRASAAFQKLKVLNLEGNQISTSSALQIPFGELTVLICLIPLLES